MNMPVHRAPIRLARRPGQSHPNLPTAGEHLSQRSKQSLRTLLILCFDTRELARHLLTICGQFSRTGERLRCLADRLADAMQADPVVAACVDEAIAERLGALASEVAELPLCALLQRWQQATAAGPQTTGLLWAALRVGAPCAPRIELKLVESLTDRALRVMGGVA